MNSATRYLAKYLGSIALDQSLGLHLLEGRGEPRSKFAMPSMQIRIERNHSSHLHEPTQGRDVSEGGSVLLVDHAEVGGAIEVAAFREHHSQALRSIVHSATAKSAASARR